MWNGVKNMLSPASANATTLVTACGSGDLDTVQRQLELGQDVNSVTPDEHAISPLHAAAFHGQVDTVKYLVEKAGAFLNPRDAEGATPVHLACQKGHYEIVKYLVQMGASMLLKDQGGRLPLHYAARGGFIETLKFVLFRPNTDANEQDAAGETPVYFAAYFGNEACLRVLVEVGADVNVPNGHGDLPVMWCAFNGHAASLSVLIQSGNLKLNCRNSYGWNPLHIAAHMGQCECLKVLLEEGHMDPNDTTPEGLTALHIAVMEDKTDVIRLLISYGADVNAANASGHTPLHLVISAEAATILLSEGQSDLHVVDNDGKTPFEIVVDDEAAAVIRAAWEQQAMLYVEQHPEDAEDVVERINWVASLDNQAERSPNTTQESVEGEANGGTAGNGDESADVDVDVDDDGVEEGNVDWYTTPSNDEVQSVADPRHAFGSDATRSVSGDSSSKPAVSAASAARSEMYQANGYKRGPGSSTRKQLPGGGAKATLPHQESGVNNQPPALPHMMSPVKKTVPSPSRPSPGSKSKADTPKLPHESMKVVITDNASPPQPGLASPNTVTDCDSEGNLFKRTSSKTDVRRDANSGGGASRPGSSAHLRDGTISASPIGSHVYRGSAYSPDSPIIADIQTYDMKGPSQSPDVFDTSKESINDVRPGSTGASGRPPRHNSAMSRGTSRLSQVTTASPSPPPAPSQSPLVPALGQSPDLRPPSSNAASPQLVGGPHIPYGARILGDTPSPTLGASPSPQPVLGGASMWEDKPDDRGLRSR